MGRDCENGTSEQTTSRPFFFFITPQDVKKVFLISPGFSRPLLTTRNAFSGVQEIRLRRLHQRYVLEIAKTTHKYQNKCLLCWWHFICFILVFFVRDSSATMPWGRLRVDKGLTSKTSSCTAAPRRTGSKCRVNRKKARHNYSGN